MPTALRIERCRARIALERERIALQATLVSDLAQHGRPRVLRWGARDREARPWARWLTLIAPMVLPLVRRHRWARRSLRLLTYWRLAAIVWRTARAVVALRLSEALERARMEFT